MDYCFHGCVSHLCRKCVEDERDVAAKQRDEAVSHRDDYETLYIEKCIELRKSREEVERLKDRLSEEELGRRSG
jgi:hypothetical protein